MKIQLKTNLKILSKVTNRLNSTLEIDGVLHTRQTDLTNPKHMVGAAALYLLMEVWQGGKIGVRRYAVINAQKSPIFVDFRQPDTENFCQGFQGLCGKRSTPGQGPMGSCSGRWDSSHPGNMHGRVLLHGRLPGIAKEGQTLLLLMVGKTCVLSLISNQVINK
jgi:hypothetical protein